MLRRPPRRASRARIGVTPRARRRALARAMPAPVTRGTPPRASATPGANSPSVCSRVPRTAPRPPTRPSARSLRVLIGGLRRCRKPRTSRPAARLRRVPTAPAPVAPARTTLTPARPRCSAAIASSCRARVCDRRCRASGELPGGSRRLRVAMVQLCRLQGLTERRPASGLSARGRGPPLANDVPRLAQMPASRLTLSRPPPRMARPAIGNCPRARRAALARASPLRLGRGTRPVGSATPGANRPSASPRRVLIGGLRRLRPRTSWPPLRLRRVAITGLPFCC